MSVCLCVHILYKTCVIPNNNGETRNGIPTFYTTTVHSIHPLTNHYPKIGELYGRELKYENCEYIENFQPKAMYGSGF